MIGDPKQPREHFHNRHDYLALNLFCRRSNIIMTPRRLACRSSREGRNDCLLSINTPCFVNSHCLKALIKHLLGEVDKTFPGE